MHNYCQEFIRVEFELSSSINFENIEVFFLKLGQKLVELLKNSKITGN